MEKRILGRTGLQVGFIGFGALEIGRDWGLGPDKVKQRPSEQDTKNILNTALDLGINLIDTASAYHLSEERIGKFIANRRNEYFLASKCGEHNDEPGTYYDFSYKAVKESIDKSLNLLKTDVIDIMQIHFGPHPEMVLKDGETLAAMQDSQREGKIRFLGASPPFSVLNSCIETDVFDVLQINYSLLNRESEELIKKAADKNIGILIRGGLAAGYLTKKVKNVSPDYNPGKIDKVNNLLELLDNNYDLLPVAALQFLNNNKNISSVLVGTKNIRYLEKAINAFDVKLPVEISEI